MNWTTANKVGWREKTPDEKAVEAKSKRARFEELVVKRLASHGTAGTQASWGELYGADFTVSKVRSLYKDTGISAGERIKQLIKDRCARYYG